MFSLIIIIIVFVSVECMLGGTDLSTLRNHGIRIGAIKKPILQQTTPFIDFHPNVKWFFYLSFFFYPNKIWLEWLFHKYIHHGQKFMSHPDRAYQVLLDKDYFEKMNGVQHIYNNSDSTLNYLNVMRVYYIPKY